MEAAFICGEELWSRGFGEDHPLRPERLRRTYDLLTAYHAFDAPISHLVEPHPATRDELLLFHTCVGYLAHPLELLASDVRGWSR